MGAVGPVFLYCCVRTTTNLSQHLHHVTWGPLLFCGEDPEGPLGSFPACDPVRLPCCAFGPQKFLFLEHLPPSPDSPRGPPATTFLYFVG